MAPRTSGYGVRIHPVTKTEKMHDGEDYAAPVGSQIYAQKPLTVEYAGTASGYGNVIYARDAQGNQFRFGHLDSIPDNVKKGTTLGQGDLIAYTGNTGTSSGAHLHYEVREQDPATGRLKPVDPSTRLDVGNGGQPYINAVSFSPNGGSLKNTNPTKSAGYAAKNPSDVVASNQPTTRSAKPTIPQKGAQALPGARAPSSFVDLSVNPLLKLGDT